MLIRIATAVTLLFGFITSANAQIYGRTLGNFQVSNNGSAQYTIPIWSPPGPNGLQPNLTLVYDSQASIGPLGAGWSIAGLGAITRCNQTVAQDGAAAPVALAQSDAYCINGVRLRQTDSSTYGGPGSVYQTEIADFSQITAVGSTTYNSVATGPQSFTVQGRNGSTYQYGYTDSNGNGANSAAVASTSNTTVLTWFLSKVTDNAGNTMVINYVAPSTTAPVSLTGTTVPSTIYWTPTSAGASNYTYEMLFVYGNGNGGGNTLQSSPSGYVAGNLVSNNELLTSIEVLSSGAVVKDYFLGYQVSPLSGREQLNSIQECADTGKASCFAASSVSYQGGSAGVATSATPVFSGTGTNLAARYDLNGDGIPDIVYTSSGQPTKVAFGSSTGYASPITVTSGSYSMIGNLTGGNQDGVLVASGSTWQYWTYNGSTFSSVTAGNYETAGIYYQLADVNGDGLPDLVEFTGTTTTVIKVQLNTSSGGVLSFASPVTALTFNQYNQLGGKLVTPDQQYGKMRRFDFNGDGLDDLVMQIYTSAPHQSSNTTTYELLAGPSTTFTAYKIAGPHGPLNDAVFVTNWNDDKCTDVALWDSYNGTNAILQVSACNGQPAVSYNLSSSVVGAMDWDGDGRTDLLMAPTSGSNLNVYISSASSTPTLSSTSVPYSAGCVYVTLDVTGSGLDDLGCWNGQSGGSTAISYYLHNGTTDLATSFVDGYGLAYKPTYVSLSNAGKVYGVGTSQLPSGYQNYIGPLYVVSKYTASDGLMSGTATYEIDKYYSKAVVQTTGYGFQGFNQIRTIDYRTGNVEYQYFSQTFPLTGLITLDNITQTNTTKTIRTTTNHLSAYYLSSTQAPARWFPSIDRSTVAEYEVGGPRDATLSKTTVTTTDGNPDAFGNFASVTSTITDNDSYGPYNGKTWTTKVATTYVADTGHAAHWCNSLPSQIVVTRSNSAGSGSAIPRTVNFTADTDVTKCRQGYQLVSTAGSAYDLNTQYLYDNFGNVKQQTVTGVASQSNSTPMTRTSYVDWGATGQFPTTLTNALNQVSSQTHDPTFGTLTSSTDSNGIKTSWGYDAFGRKTSELRPDGTSTAWAYNNCVSGGCVNGNNRMTIVATRLNTDQKTVLRTDKTYLDEYDRVLVTSGQMLGGAYDKNEVQYDAVGRVAQQAMPCAYSNCSSPYWTVYSYDVINRVTQIQRPTNQSNSNPQSTNISYQAREVVTTDANQHTSTNTYLVTGSLQSTKDMNGYAIIYTRDAWDSPLNIKDNQATPVSWQTNSYAYGVTPFLTKTTDLDFGSKTYTLDSFGEVLSYIDTKSNNFTFLYDALGRINQRAATDLTTNWTWGATASSYNIGKLQQMSSTEASGNYAYSDTYTYNSKGQLTDRTMNLPIDGAHSFDFAYDPNTGLLSTATYPYSTNPSTYRLTAAYTYQSGILQSISDALIPSTIWWKANTTNPRGQITNETTSASSSTAQIVAAHTYDAVTGWLSANTAGVSGGNAAGLQNESYLYDPVGNVTQRQNNNAGLTESFNYDNLNRLYQSYLQSPQNNQQSTLNLQMCYDNTGGACNANQPGPGNITARSDVAGQAQWTYDTSHPHHVTQAGSASYTYQFDSNGNVNSRNGSNIGFTTYNYPSYVQTSTESATFDYGPDLQRWRMVYKTGGTTETTYYASPLFEKVAPSSGNTDYRHYIYVGGRAVLVISRTASATNVRSLLTDHQGGVSTIVQDSTGASYETESFTAYGNRRDATSWAGSPTTADRTAMDGVTREGYTFQTVLGSMGLNHMKGRIQDSITGVFLSADPYLPNPGDTRSYNRYSYVNNNPLSLIDPSGSDDVDDDPLDDPGDSSGDPQNTDTGTLPSPQSSFTQSILYNGGVQADFAAYEGINPNNFEVSSVTQALPDGTPNQLGEVTVTGRQVYGTNFAPLFGGIVQYNPLYAGAETAYIGFSGALNIRGLWSLYGLGRALFAARGVGLAGSFTSVTNAVGGKVYTSVGEINQFNFRGIVNAELYNGRVSILTGVDGFADGTRVAASDLFEADIARFGGIPGVTVYNLPIMSDLEITSVLNGPGAVIGAFCNSGVCLAPFW